MVFLLQIRYTIAREKKDIPEVGTWKWNKAYWEIRHEKNGSAEFYPGCDVEKTLNWLDSLKSKEKKIFSQNGEDGITEAIFEKIGSGGKYFVEFGVGDGSECLSRLLRENYGWKGATFDRAHAKNLNSPHYLLEMWVDNIVSNFQSKNISKTIDFLSVDTDFGDFWLIKTILEAGYKPRVIAIEFNRNLGPYSSLTVPLSGAMAHMIHDATNFFGASALAFSKLLRSFGFNLVHVDEKGINLFFVDESEFFGMDFALAKWIEILSSGTLVGQHLHYHDSEKRPFQHVCLGHSCSDSSNW